MRTSRAVLAGVALAACAPDRGTLYVGAAPTSEPAGTTPAPSPTEPPAAEVRVETAAGAMPPTLTATPPPGIYADDVTVDLVSSDPDAVIWYTVNGAAPAVGTAGVWSGPLTVPSSAVIRAIAVNAHGTGELAGVWLHGDATVATYSSDLPLVVLWTTAAAPEWKDESYTPFTVSVFEPGAGARVQWPTAAALSTRAGLKVRGSSSAGYPKHPYRLETWGVTHDRDVDVAILGMAPEADWVLGAPLDFDRALMRDPLMFALSNLIGRWAPATRFAEVFVADQGETVGNDDYVGVYVVTERIERDADRVDVEALLPTDVTLPALSGGYVFKEDRLGPEELGFYAGDAGGLLDFAQPFVAVDPAEAELAPEQAAYLVAELDELGEALVSPGFTHPLTGRHYEAILDVDAWIDHHILNVLSKNPDAFRLSGYFHKDREAPIHAGPIWDFDRTMGCESDSRAEDPTWWDAQNETTDCTAVFDHGYWRGLFADPAFRDRYWARWRELLDSTLSVASLHAIVDGFAAELTESAVRNYLAWPDYPPRGGDHAGEVAILKDWLAARHAWIDGCLALPDPRTCTGD